jgi:hypothetical protein
MPEQFGEEIFISQLRGLTAELAWVEETVAELQHRAPSVYRGELGPEWENDLAQSISVAVEAAAATLERAEMLHYAEE